MEIESLIEKYIEKIKDPDSNYYAGVAALLISYIELNRINSLLKDTSKNSTINYTKALILECVEKDKDYFNKPTPELLEEMVINYTYITNNIDLILGKESACKNCQEITNYFPLLDISSSYLRKLCADYESTNTKDVKTIDLSLDCYCFKSDINKNSLYANTYISLALLNKLLVRRSRFKNKLNLPIDLGIELTSSILITKLIRLDTLKNIKRILIEISNNTVSSVKIDYILIYKYLKEIIDQLEKY